MYLRDFLGIFLPPKLHNVVYNKAIEKFHIFFIWSLPQNNKHVALERSLWLNLLCKMKLLPEQDLRWTVSIVLGMKKVN